MIAQTKFSGPMASWFRRFQKKNEVRRSGICGLRALPCVVRRPPNLFPACLHVLNCFHDIYLTRGSTSEIFLPVTSRQDALLSGQSFFLAPTLFALIQFSNVSGGASLLQHSQHLLLHLHSSPDSPFFHFLTHCSLPTRDESRSACLVLLTRIVSVPYK